MNQINQSEKSKRKRLKNLLIFLFSVFFIGALFFFDKIGEKVKNDGNNIRNERIEKTCNKCGKEYYYTH